MTKGLMVVILVSPLILLLESPARQLPATDLFIKKRLGESNALSHIYFLPISADSIAAISAFPGQRKRGEERRKIPGRSFFPLFFFFLRVSLFCP